MQRTMLLSVIVITMLLTLTGCWDSQELDELAVVVGMAVDKEDEEYRVSFQIVNAAEVSAQTISGGAAPVTMRSEKAPTIYEAGRKTSMVTPKRIRVSHLRVLVISEEVAREDITNVLDLISRDREFRADFIVIIAKDMKAMDTLKILTTLEKIPANQLYSSLKTSQEVWAESININFRELMKLATVEGNSIVLSGIEVKGDIKTGDSTENTDKIDSPTKLVYSGIAVFDKTKLIGWLTSDEGKGYSYVTNQINNTVEHLDCSNDEKMSVEITDSKTKLKATFNEAKQPKMTINVRTNANIGSSACSFDLTKPTNISKVEGLLEEKISNIIDNTIKKVQADHPVDIFGFGQEIHAHHPKEWRKLKNDWDKHISELEVEIKVKAAIHKVGTIRKPVKDELKE